MSTQEPCLKYARIGRRRKEVPDLNVPPVVENLELAMGPTNLVGQVGHGENPAIPVAHGAPAPQPAWPTQPAPIDVEELDDDDVVISSPRAFEEAKLRSRRRRRTVVFDLESEDVAFRNVHYQANKRRRIHTNPPIINHQLYVNLEESSSSNFLDHYRRKVQYYAPPLPPPPPPPPEPVFTCPVCMGPIVEEVTTKCGHIFCMECIKSAISAQHKCPTCRHKLTNKSLIRIYLPATK
ncbi:uncharacterized protein [Rutidosis leptorrhynchoides]|uniref:uncharacterized protein isoform X2 n=1 Tax=Rutidosis leptorrhynchoides TaxID=125765 RepID=UPI003A990FE0